MAGIYLHIPFCKKACFYCDFHFSTSVKYRQEVIQAMHSELELQKGHLAGAPIETIYFGGGTPSILSSSEIQKFIDHISALHWVSASAEITLEANPDDLDEQQVRALRQTSINRFSIGVQSFYEEDLRWMNRAHTASEADGAVKRVQDAGFENITLDLIYGYPLLSDQKWASNIAKVIELGVPHLSAYAMTVEHRTALAHFIKKGKQPDMDDHQSSSQFLALIAALTETGFDHYEISNFAKPGFYSRHNTSYWKGVSYLGIGPSAHSFNGTERRWNIANNARYMESLSKGLIAAERETLTRKDRVNEYIMTSLRTMWGMDLLKIEKEFGHHYRLQVEHQLEEFAKKGWLDIADNIVTLSLQGKLFADHIAASLFTEEE